MAGWEKIRNEGDKGGEIMKKLICEICGNQFEAEHSRSWGNYCKECAGWLRALKWGPFQDHHASYEKLGMTFAYLIKKGELKEEDFIHGLIQGIKRNLIDKGSLTVARLL